MSIETATNALIAEFRARPTPRAGSLIITVFGDAIAPRGGTVWLGSLIRVLADFGISERLVRTSVFRLSRDDWLLGRQVGRRSYYSLTDGGAQRFEQATHRIYGEPRQTWSGDWCLVLLAGLDGERKESVRRELAWLGFGAMSTNVLAHPAPDIVELETLLKRLGVHEALVVMQGSTLGPTQDRAMRELVRKSWNLDDIDTRYAAFVDQFRPVFRAVQKAPPRDPRRAFQIRMLLIQEYRKILLRDPLLPAELLPTTWHGTPAYRLCRNLYRKIYAAADGFMSEELETAEGPLPPPAPDFYHRFGGLR